MRKGDCKIVRDRKRNRMRNQNERTGDIVLFPLLVVDSFAYLPAIVTLASTFASGG